MKKYQFNLISMQEFSEDEIDNIYEFMDDGKEDSIYKVVGSNIDDDGEGHLTIDGTYPDDLFSDDTPDEEYPETNFDENDIDSALGELRTEYDIIFSGTFSIIDDGVAVKFDEFGKKL